MTLASGRPIRLIVAPYFLATKLVAFHDPGNRDFVHHDMEDIITIVNGRPEVVAEVDSSEVDVKTFLREEFEDLILDNRFVEQMERFFESDEASQGRVPTVLARLSELSGS